MRVQEHQCGQIICLNLENVATVVFHLNEANHRDRLESLCPGASSDQLAVGKMGRTL